MLRTCPCGDAFEEMILRKARRTSVSIFMVSCVYSLELCVVGIVARRVECSEKTLLKMCRNIQQRLCSTDRNLVVDALPRLCPPVIITGKTRNDPEAIQNTQTYEPRGENRCSGL